MSSEEKILVSVVVPAFNEAENIPVLYDSLADVLQSRGFAWELVFADDGSRDDTWKTILNIHANDDRVKGVRLSRNFGHQNALLAGLQHSRGAAVISMDADMQHPPEVVPLLVDEWQAGNMIVKTKRADSADLSRFKRLTSRFFYRVFSFMSGVPLENGMADFRLIDRQVLHEILQFREEGLFLRGIVEWVGFPTSTVPYRPESRLSGETKYTLRKMIKFAWHGVSSFSLVPLRVGVVIGFAASAFSFVASFYAVLAKLVTGSVVPGWASSLAILSFLFGTLFFYLGLLGEYLGRVLIEVRSRPRFLVRERIGIRE